MWGGVGAGGVRAHLHSLTRFHALWAHAASAMGSQMGVAPGAETHRRGHVPTFPPTFTHREALALPEAALLCCPCPSAVQSPMARLTGVPVIPGKRADLGRPSSSCLKQEDSSQPYSAPHPRGWKEQ